MVNIRAFYQCLLFAALALLVVGSAVRVLHDRLPAEQVVQHAAP